MYLQFFEVVITSHFVLTCTILHNYLCNSPSLSVGHSENVHAFFLMRVVTLLWSQRRYVFLRVCVFVSSLSEHLLESKPKLGTRFYEKKKNGLLFT